MSIERYHPVLIALHWLMALLVIVALGMGMFVLAATPNDAPDKIDALKGHMIAGVLLLTLTIIRLMVRVSTKKPRHATAGNPLLDKLSVLIHMGFYIALVAMATSGILTALGADLPNIVFNGSGQPLPKDFNDIPARGLHGIIANLLVVMIVLHVAGAFFHQHVLKDNLISRMKFGKNKNQF